MPFPILFQVCGTAFLRRKRGRKTSGLIVSLVLCRAKRDRRRQ